MSKIPCSVPILTLNSGKWLRRCLASVADFADVYILDGNSTDDTLAIAREFGVPVYKQFASDEPNIKITNFTEIREKATSLMRTDWYFQLDSDEFVPPDLVEEIKQAFASNPGPKTAYNIQKKYVIRDKKIEYAFNYPNYWVRLYHRQSGIGWKPGKKHHEQLYIPPDVRIINMNSCVWTGLPDTYRDCVHKDKFSMAEIKKITLDPNRKKDTRPHALKIAGLYFLRAGNTIFRSLVVYLKHGYARSLPFGHVMRHVRNHLLMTWWRLQQVFLGK